VLPFSPALLPVYFVLYIVILVKINDFDELMMMMMATLL